MFTSSYEKQDTKECDSNVARTNTQGNTNSTSDSMTTLSDHYAWQKHSSAIALKIMNKMGYKGEGLGKGYKGEELREGYKGKVLGEGYRGKGLGKGYKGKGLGEGNKGKGLGKGYKGKGLGKGYEGKGLGKGWERSREGL